MRSLPAFLVGLLVITLNLNLGLGLSPARGDDYPKTILQNGSIALTVYLPDAKSGFYHGTRFDWSGVIGQIEVASDRDGGRKHVVFGPWKDTHDPANHDDIVGPVEEFGNQGPLGYDEAKPGDAFLKIGVGELVKLKDEPYRFSGRYPLKHPGVWNVETHPTEAIFTQLTSSETGYGYRYSKRIALDPSRSAFTIHHELANAGTRPIDTDQYNHNFFNVDNDPIGPAYRLTFPAPPRPADPRGRFQELLSLRDTRTLAFAAPLDAGTLHATLAGLAGRSGPITLTHAPSGIALVIEQDTPFEKVNLWGMSRTICPEPFTRITLRPGESKAWSIRYTFGAASP